MMNRLTLHAPRYVLGELLLTWASRVRRADVVLVVGGAVLIGVAAQIAVPVPGSPVPVTGQTLAMFLCAAVLGPRRGPAAVLTYMLAGLAGIPWIAGQSPAASGHPGLAWFAGPTAATFGYLAGMVGAAAVVGALARRPRWVVPALLLGCAVIYAVGVPWLALALELDARTAIAVGLTPLLPGDAVKIAIAAGVLALVPVSALRRTTGDR